MNAATLVMFAFQHPWIPVFIPPIFFKDYSEVMLADLVGNYFYPDAIRLAAANELLRRFALLRVPEWWGAPIATHPFGFLLIQTRANYPKFFPVFPY